MDIPKVSIIIPVHNAGEYFEKCLTSLTNQTLKEVEIILVLDCPTDGSDKVAEEFASLDSRIKLLRNTENLHTGLSRNRGIAVAKGKYIGFHDHDDYSEPTMYELLYEKAESEQEAVVRCGFNCIYTQKEKWEKEEYKYPDQSFNLSDKNWLYEYVAGNKISCVIWNHIYRADFLKQHNIKFLDSRTICSEDSIFFLEVYQNLNKLGIVPEYLYSHVFHESNTGKVYSYRSIENRILFFEKLYSLLLTYGVEKEKAEYWLTENVIRSFYTASRQALILLPLKQAFVKIRLVKQSQLIVNCIDNVYKKGNKSLLKRLKMTTVAYFFCLRKLLLD